MSAPRQGGALRGLRETNQRLVVDVLRQRGGLSQAEIARATGLSPASVSNLVRTLTDQGTARASRVQRNGGRGVEVTLNPASGLVAGVDFGNRHMNVAIADVAHTIVAEEQTALAAGHLASDGVARAAATIHRLVESTGRCPDELIGVAVGLPGPINRDTGSIASAGILPGWAGINIQEAFEASLPGPVIVDNDANLGAVGEALWGAGRGCSDFAYLKVSTGIGAGLVLNGRLYRGALGTAGEIGHTTIEEDGPVCRCGNRGCLEVLAGAPALIELLRNSHGDELTVEDILKLSADGDVGCRRVIADAGRHIGVAVANLCNLLSPERIVVGGELALAGEVLLSSLREAMTRRAISITAETTQVVLGTLRERSAVLGAVGLALQESERFTIPSTSAG